MLLYKDISLHNILERKNWEAEKLYNKYLILIIATNFIPIANLVLSLILTLKFLSSLHKIYLGYPLFNSGFFDFLRKKTNLTKEQRKNLLNNLYKKTGLKIFLHLDVGLSLRLK